MKMAFIDSDVLLDVILNRELFYSTSAQILSLPESSGYKCCTSVHTLLNVHYFTKKNLGAIAARETVKLLVNQLQIISEDVTIVNQAIASEFNDFEDAVQFYAAKSVTADIIITRNIKDYRKSTIPVLTAEQFLRTL
ncbi:type II toxin-antitoxin system VapC family toxin [Mucilaginibacter dorajii]|uniref:PIN domain-containing protein n=1 Tax=Mucilaginibacter dorajii TaxID=692994 RepID=A0ABP7QGQ9_9SPHI|nr:PIN domain-containing protein [Mucilaginibacter dorajii]MCS3736091.1 putative nucleic acid-binding protein [Mucilaginibacter dorajii]